MGARANIIAVEPALVDEMWRRRPMYRLQSQGCGRRLAAYCEMLVSAGADEGGPLAEAVREVDAATGRAVFEALCESIGDGIWDVPGWALRPFLDVAGLLARGRTPYPQELEPDGFSTPELYVWLDGREEQPLVQVQQRLRQHASEKPSGEDPVLAQDVREALERLLGRVAEEKLLLLVEHPHGL